MLEVNGQRKRGRPRHTCMRLIAENVKRIGLEAGVQICVEHWGMILQN